MKFFNKVKRGFNNLVDKVKSGFTNVTQKYEYDCGPAAVSMLLDLYDINYTEERLIKLLKTTEEGTNWESMEDFLLNLDKFELRQRFNNPDSADVYLKQGFPLLICWDVECNPKYSHYSVLLALDKPKIKMLDPEDTKKVTEYKYDYFLKCWKMEHCWFAVLIPDKSILNKNKIEEFLS